VLSNVLEDQFVPKNFDKLNIIFAAGSRIDGSGVACLVEEQLGSRLQYGRINQHNLKNYPTNSLNCLIVKLF
jgi:hypothetical protein